MSGDSQRADEPDFLDDDFVIEDLAGKGDDLEHLFEDPAAPAARKPGEPAGIPDADDVLFTDHTPAGDVSERFQGGSAFGEQAKSNWQGDSLELDDGTTDVDPRIAAAKAAITDELGAMLHNDEELPLDSEDELELVDGPSATDADGISEIEQSGPFVLDDGDGAWQEQQNEQPDLQVEGDSAPAPLDADVAEGVWEAVQDPAMAEHADDSAAVVEEGWEALPENDVDALAEVDAVERADEQPAPEELAEVDGHDIYGEEADAPVLVGPVAVRRRTFGVVASLAASLALVGGAAVVVMRPEWVGLTFEPQRVQQVQLERPVIQVAMTAPPVPAPQLGQTLPEPEPEPEPQPQPDVPTPAPADPVAHVPVPPADVTPPVDPDPIPAPPAPEPLPADPVASAPNPAPEGAAVAPEPSGVAWPVATAPDPTRMVRPNNGKPLVRMSEDTMVGELDPQPPVRSVVQAVEGVLPGTRAFAQLRNGNYFIGSIKVASADTVTLRLAEGEVTLLADDISRLTALGSADYEALQKATSGFVRLTNNNRLVGGILSQIADDHIVLEFRSNRVMLPKSAISQVGEGEEQQAVRLDITREEDDWVRSMIERQIGRDTGKSEPAPKSTAPKTPSPSTPSTPPKPPAPR